MSVRLRILFESIKNESWNSYYMWELFWLSFFMLTLPEDLEIVEQKEKENMNAVEAFDELQRKARHDDKLREQFIKTRDAEDSLGAFCSVCREAGYELYPMDIVQAGDEFYAAMKRSTNGGGENSPVLIGEDDPYELFFAGLQEQLQ